MDNMENDNMPRGLFSEFPPVSTAEWEAIIHQDLKGADYEKKLIWKTTEGFKVKPYYRAEDLVNLKAMLASLPGQFPFLRGTTNDNNHWKIAQDIETPDLVKANKLATDASSRGADAVFLNASKIKSAKDISALLKGIDLGKTMIGFNSAPSYPLLFNYLTDSIKATGIDSSKVNGMLDYDPLSFVLMNGYFYKSEEADMNEGVQLIKDAQKALPEFRVLTVNGQYFHNSGSTLTQELAFALSAGNEYLAYYTSKGLSVDEVASRMTFLFAIGSNYFMEIAKLRAARLLWAQIVNQYKPVHKQSAGMYIHSMTANWNKTIYDPYVNLLRTTTEAMSAAIGNADMITVLPFDLDYEEPDDFSLRIARNQQIILKEESNLDKVIDPAAGSYYVENLTSSLAAAAWELFIAIEEEGGMLEAIKKGFIQDEVAASAKQKKEDIATRRILALGTNQHPNLNENMLEKIQMEADTEEVESEPFRKPQYKTIEVFRGTDDFEDLRLATEIWENEGNKRPSVFMLTIGNHAMRKARAAFATSFFGCAGYTIMDNAGFASVDEGVKAALNSKAEVVAICSSDEEYAELAPEITRSIKALNPDILITVAGYPKDIIENLKNEGVFEFIHVKSNVLDTLYRFQQKLEVML